MIQTFVLARPICSTARLFLKPASSAEFVKQLSATDERHMPAALVSPDPVPKVVLPCLMHQSCDMLKTPSQLLCDRKAECNRCSCMCTDLQRVPDCRTFHGDTAVCISTSICEEYRADRIASTILTPCGGLQALRVGHFGPEAFFPMVSVQFQGFCRRIL
jgi:hypothetical protein